MGIFLWMGLIFYKKFNHDVCALFDVFRSIGRWFMDWVDGEMGLADRIGGRLFFRQQPEDHFSERRYPMRLKNKGVRGIVAGLVGLMMASATADAGERFVDNKDGTITDHKAKLIGLAKADCFQGRNWEYAKTAVGNIANGLCGLSDGSPPGSWRLPEKRELPILLEWKKSRIFKGVNADFYWSGTTHEEDESLAWVIFLTTGYIGSDVKTNKSEFWPVRDLK